MDVKNEKSVTLRTLSGIAAKEGTSPENLDFVLTDYVDPDALERLVENSGANWTLEMQISGHVTTVCSDGSVRIDGDLF